MRRVVYVFSNLDKPNMIELVADHVDRSRFEVILVALNAADSYVERYYRERDFETHRIVYRSRRDFPRAAAQLAALMARLRPDVVHARMFDATVMTLPIAFALRTLVRVYHRDHSDFHHRYFPRAVKYDRMANMLATDIVAPSRLVADILVHREGAVAKKVHVIDNPFELAVYAQPEPDVVRYVADKYNPERRTPVIGIIARWEELKGLRYSVPAVKRLLAEFPDLLLVLANARGADEAATRELLRGLPDRNCVSIVFEERNTGLYPMFDVFVHVPIALDVESAGGVYVEAQAAGVPCVFTLSGVAPEFIVDGTNALVVPYRDEEATYQALRRVLREPELRKRLSEGARRSVRGRFSPEAHTRALERIYER